MVAAALASLWAAIAALSILVIRDMGWRRAMQRRVTLAALALALMGPPAAVVVKVAERYRSRIVAFVTRPKSPAIALPPGCSVFPENNIWNTVIRDLPRDAKSEAYVAAIGSSLPLHADFGYASGIAYTVAAGNESAEVFFGSGAAQSDPGPYYIPDHATVESGPDRHVLVVDERRCALYELFGATRHGAGMWEASSGAIFDLKSNRLRPPGWTSADAAGLPIFPGLVRYDEAQSGRIAHALRFTARRTRRAYVWPARHFASSLNDPRLPPLGQRFRLRASFDLSSFGAEARVILEALQTYGMMLADNGGPWYLTGAPDSRWSRQVAAELGRVRGEDFEAVDTTALMANPASAEVRPEPALERPNTDGQVNRK